MRLFGKGRRNSEPRQLASPPFDDKEWRRLLKVVQAYASVRMRRVNMGIESARADTKTALSNGDLAVAKRKVEPTVLARKEIEALYGIERAVSSLLRTLPALSTVASLSSLDRSVQEHLCTIFEAADSPTRLQDIPHIAGLISGHFPQSAVKQMRSEVEADAGVMSAKSTPNPTDGEIEEAITSIMRDYNITEIDLGAGARSGYEPPPWRQGSDSGRSDPVGRRAITISPAVAPSVPPAVPPAAPTPSGYGLGPTSLSSPERTAMPGRGALSTAPQSASRETISRSLDSRGASATWQQASSSHGGQIDTFLDHTQDSRVQMQTMQSAVAAPSSRQTTRFGSRQPLLASGPSAGREEDANGTRGSNSSVRETSGTVQSGTPGVQGGASSVVAVSTSSVSNHAFVDDDRTLLVRYHELMSP